MLALAEARSDDSVDLLSTSSVDCFHRSVAVRDLVCVVGNSYLEIDGYFTKSFDAGALRVYILILQTNTVQKWMNSLAAYR
ncbi:hypothetical protein [Leisingera daeponensis]|uniref:hypothetical protein n=1 Tax=Leisingera daeponensis TaxID=405746 RepID=UPI001C95D1D3|nr:hypothetical protein [Leisingera daeponensis]MBY6058788.1 hypothetical protein [Leisingera daeponensis]